MTDLTWVQEGENELPEAVRELIREAHSENTRRAYQSDLRSFRRWGGDVPTTPHELARYIAEEGERLHPSTIQRRLAALSVAHRLSGGSGHPTHHPLVKAALRGLQRVSGVAQDQAAPLMVEDLWAILDKTGECIRDQRDRALLLIGFAGGLRRSELVGLDLADLEFVREGLILTLRRSKTDQEGRGRRIGITHHPHVHMIVPGGGLSADGSQWVPCRANFFLPVRVLSRLFRRLFLDGLAKLHREGRLSFFGDHAGLADGSAFNAFLEPLRRTEWVVYAKEPFAGPKAVLAYLSRYTHRVAIANSRLIRADVHSVTFRVKDYRIDGPGRYTTMPLNTHEFIRRFLIHVLPKGQHRIRHYGLFANGGRAANIARIRELLAALAPTPNTEGTNTVEGPRVLALPCPCCGGRLIIVEAFGPGGPPHHRPAPEGIDSS